MFTHRGYVILPEYTLYVASIVLILLILTVICLIYLILSRRYRMIRTNVSSNASCVEYLKPKTSFHLPRIHLPRFQKLPQYVGESGSKENIIYIEPEHDGSESNPSTSYNDRVKKQVADQITIIPPEKMKELITDVVNQVNLKNSQKLQMPVIATTVPRNDRRSFANLKDKCASVPDLSIYDVVPRVRPVEMEGSVLDGTNESDYPGVKIVQLFSDRHSGYRSPLTLKMMYSNANVR